MNKHANPFDALKYIGNESSLPATSGKKNPNTEKKKRQRQKKKAQQAASKQASVTQNDKHQPSQPKVSNKQEDVEVVIVDGEKYYFPKDPVGPSTQNNASPVEQKSEEILPSTRPYITPSSVITFEEETLPPPKEPTHAQSSGVQSHKANSAPPPSAKVQTKPPPKAPKAPTAQVPTASASSIHQPQHSQIPVHTQSDVISQDPRIARLEETVAKLETSLAAAIAAQQKTELALYNIQQVVTVLANENRSLRHQIQLISNYLIASQQFLQQQALSSNFGCPPGISVPLPTQNGGMPADQRMGQRTFLKSLLEQIVSSNTSAPQTDATVATNASLNISEASDEAHLPPGVLDIARSMSKQK